MRMMRLPRGPIQVAFLALLLTISVVPALAHVRAAHAGAVVDPPLAYFVAPDPPVYVGDVITVDLMASDFPEFGAYEIVAGYEDLAFTFVDADDGPLLGSTGRAVGCSGATAVNGVIRLGCATFGATPAGASGDGVLVRLTFEAEAVGTFAFTLREVGLGSILGDDLDPITTNGTTVTVDPEPSPTATSTPVAGGAAAALVAPADPIYVGDEITVALDGTLLPNLGAFEVELTWDASKLSIVSGSDSGFLGSTGRPVFCPPPSLVLGGARWGCGSSGQGVGPSGDGTLAYFVFVALERGPAVISLNKIQLCDELCDVSYAASVSGTAFEILSIATVITLEPTETEVVAQETETPAPIDTATSTSEPEATETIEPDGTQEPSTTTPLTGTPSVETTSTVEVTRTVETTSTAEVTRTVETTQTVGPPVTTTAEPDETSTAVPTETSSPEPTREPEPSETSKPELTETPTPSTKPELTATATPSAEGTPKFVPPTSTTTPGAATSTSVATATNTPRANTATPQASATRAASTTTAQATLSAERSQPTPPSGVTGMTNDVLGNERNPEGVALPSTGSGSAQEDSRRSTIVGALAVVLAAVMLGSVVVVRRLRPGPPR